MLKTQPSNLLKYFVEETYILSSIKSIGDRTKSIGGSEIYDACCSSQSSTLNLIKNKTGLGYNISNNAAIIHGNIYEATTMKIAMMELNCMIVEPNGGYKIKQYQHNSYSADGVGTVMLNSSAFRWFQQNACTDERDIVKKANLGGKSGNEYSGYIAALPHNIMGNSAVDVLFEFKSPYSRILNNKVANKYCHQICAGMDIIREVTGGIFLQCDIKTCDGYDFTDEYCDRYGDTVISPYKDTPPTVLGKKYYIGLTEDYRHVDATNLERFRVNDRGMAHYAKYGEDYTSIDAPVFYMRDDVIIMDEFEFLKSLQSIKQHKNTPKNLRMQIEAAEEPLRVMLDESAMSILSAESDNLGQIVEFYDKLDDFFYNNLSAFAQNPWKLLKAEYHLFPSLKGFVGMYSKECTQLIEAVSACDKLASEDKLSYIEGYRLKSVSY